MKKKEIIFRDLSKWKMLSLKKRCECITINSNRRCKGKIFLEINGKKMCILHSRYYYLKAVEIIQNTYRNNKIRKAITIYKNLPDDIQRKIQFFGRENDLIKKHHHPIIIKILYYRVINLDYPEDLSINGKYKYIVSCSNLFRLFKKYHKIIPNYLHVHFAFVLQYCLDIIYQQIKQSDPNSSVNNILIEFNKYLCFLQETDKEIYSNIYFSIIYNS